MFDALLIVALLTAAVACPAMMWFAGKRGRRAPCCPPRREPAPDLAQLKAERAALDDRIAAEQASASARPA